MQNSHKAGACAPGSGKIPEWPIAVNMDGRDFLTRAPDKEARIREHLLELMKVMPIERIKVTSFSNEIGISRATFYQYYDSIYDVLQQIEDIYFESLSNWWLSDSPDHVELDNYMVRMSFGLKAMRANCDIVLTLIGKYGDKLFESKIRKRIAICVERHLGKNLNSQKNIHSAFFASGLWEVIIQWLKENDDSCISETEMAQVITRYYQQFYAQQP